MATEADRRLLVWFIGAELALGLEERDLAELATMARDKARKRLKQRAEERRKLRAAALKRS
jgi:hypothetical protein